MNNIVVLLADGCEEIEALTPVDFLRRAGDKVTTVATNTTSVNVKGGHNIIIQADIMLEDYLSSLGNKLPDAIVVPGGMPGATNIAECTKAIELISQMFENEKLVASICASPAVVLGAKTQVLEGKEWTCYPGMQTNAPLYINDYKDEPFVVDQNVITSRGPGAALQFAMEIIRYLHDDETVTKLKKASCQI